MAKIAKTTLGTTIFLLAAFTAFAETAYIKDVLVVGLRPEPQEESKPFKSVKSGDKVEVLSRSGGFAKVTIEDGSTGYISDRTLADTPPVAYSLKLAEEKIEKLSKELETLKKSTPNTYNDAELTARIQALTKENQALKSSPKGDPEAANTIQALKEENAKLKEDLTNTSQDAPFFDKESKLLWFLAGTFSVFVGWILGKLGGKKRNWSGY